jgi:hypothetical protein
MIDLPHDGVREHANTFDLYFKLLARLKPAPED